MTNLWLFGDQKCLVHQMFPYCLMTIPQTIPVTGAVPYVTEPASKSRLHGMQENPRFIVVVFPFECLLTSGFPSPP